MLPCGGRNVAEMWRYRALIEQQRPLQGQGDAEIGLETPMSCGFSQGS